MTPKSLVSADDITAGAFAFRHPLDASAGCMITPVGRITGLAKVAINLVRIAPGERAFPLHRHQGEEEWTYVIAGAGEVQLDDKAQAIGPGDFIAFAASGPAHAVRNTGTGELLCLMGGDAPMADVIDFPELGKRVVRSPAGFEAASADGFEMLFPAPKEETA